MKTEEFIPKVKPYHTLIMRGCPGSGKSTFVEALKNSQLPKYIGVRTFSADSYRMVEGAYVYKPEDNARHHLQCLRDFTKLITGIYNTAVNTIAVIDNTNTTPLEIVPYYQLALAFGWPPIIVTIKSDPAVAAGRNLHGVPRNKVLEMNDRINNIKLPRNWYEVVIDN